MDKSTQEYDVVVVGAGVIGSAIARELSTYRLRIALIDSRSDVGDGTSKANSAILHTGYDATPGTVESQLVAQGYSLLSAYAEEVGIPLLKTGALLVAWDDEQKATLAALKTKAEDNGYTKTEIVDSAYVYQKVPSLGPGAQGGLTVPDESIICTWSTTFALATDAVRRGTHLRLETSVEGIEVGPETTTLFTSCGEIHTRWLVNAAGLGADRIDEYFGYDRFHVTPRLGELLIFDKATRAMVPVIVLPVPSKLGKGVLVSPTIYGNTMVGPTAVDIEDRLDTAMTEEGIIFLREKTESLMPCLLTEEVTATYAGLRAAHDRSDYLLEADAKHRYAIAGCIRSTGLTSCMAVGKYIVDLLSKEGLDLEVRTDLPESVPLPTIGEHCCRPYENDELIESDPAYGQIVCFCERVTKGEIRDATHSTIPARSLAGLRRRTRATNGRCQGFYCGGAVQELLHNEMAKEDQS